MAINTPRSCVVVLGMHRSGTSALAKTICDMGFELPSDSMPAHHVDNPNGYFEAKELVQIHNRFLDSVGLKWNAIEPMPLHVFDGESAKQAKAELSALLGFAFEQKPQLVLKDPRLCRLFPLLLPVLKALGSQVSVVFIVRDVDAVYQSLAKRQHTPEIAPAAITDTQHVELLWLRHNLEAEQHTRGVNRFCFSYEDWLNDTQTINTKIRHFLQDTLPNANVLSPPVSVKKPRHYALSGKLLTDLTRVNSSIYAALAGRASIDDINNWFDTLYAVSRTAIPQQCEVVNHAPPFSVKLAAYIKLLTAQSAVDVTLLGNSEKAKNAYVFISATPATRSHIYRVKNPVDALIKDGQQAFWSTPEGMLPHVNLLSTAKRVIIHRCEWSQALANITQVCRENDVLVSYDIDDLIIDRSVIEAGYIDFITRQSLQEKQAWLTKADSYYRALASCDEVLCSTPALARHIQGMGHSCKVVPNGFSPETQLISEHWRQYEEQCLQPEKRIGYASGTPTHNADFATIVRPLGMWLRENPDWTFTAIGYLQLDALREMVPEKQIESRPLVQHCNLPYELSRLNINLVPLQRNPFCDAKSPLKWFEAALCGTPSIVADNPTYRRIFSAADTCVGLLADNEGDWAAHINTLATSAEARKQIANAARKRCHQILNSAVLSQQYTLDGE
ncbi:glycosyl transferase, group 1 [Paraglaciecola sp. T6c]|uniref:glycosyltransferase family protein n=1 Tax=Pseudoalteromonas atlantica (strain T6c / ATCC BAA-1087) TaxID=3042615 RepID=UPI00005C5C85|nr:glycosyltransferase [Paraglaciecola sp. T6c]ABG41726.1 glycosyl transferase, group 1 [Paraglaciecola sp. T6c]